MRKLTRALVMRVGLIAVCLASSWSWAAEATHDSIGLFTGVQGNVFIAREGNPAPRPVNAQDEVRSQDVIETQPHSRSKILLQDDSLLTIGANSRIDIVEHRYDSERSQRSTVINLDRGVLRVLLGRAFDGPNSKFEVHTPTAVVSARGSYFTVWTEEGIPPQVGEGAAQPSQAQPTPPAGPTPTTPPIAPPGPTGVVNIGNAGRVAVISGGETIVLNPHQFTTVLPKASPLPPSLLAADTPAAITGKILATEFRESPRPETPRETLRSIQPGIETGPTAATPPAAAVVPPVTRITPPLVPATPPAVISGAAPLPGAASVQPAPPPPAPAPLPPPPPPPAPRPVPPPPAPPPPPPPAPLPPPPPPPPPAVGPMPPPPPPPASPMMDDRNGLRRGSR